MPIKMIELFYRCSYSSLSMDRKRPKNDTSSIPELTYLCINRWRFRTLCIGHNMLNTTPENYHDVLYTPLLRLISSPNTSVLELISSCSCWMFFELSLDYLLLRDIFFFVVLSWQPCFTLQIWCCSSVGRDVDCWPENNSLILLLSALMISYVSDPRRNLHLSTSSTSRNESSSPQK